MDGTVFGDRNGNGAPDSGEALAGAKVRLSSSGGPDSVVVVTGADGRFDFGQQPSHVYSVSVSNLPDGWVVNSYRTVTVDG